MNKQQLIDSLATRTRTSKAHTERIIDCLIDTVKTRVTKGEPVKIVGFGTFVKARRKARNGHNPQSLETIKIPSKLYPKFKAGREFKKQVNGQL
jgi:DNA-binding protein HU-beta